MKGAKRLLVRQISYDSLVNKVYDFFGTIEDPRNRSIDYSFRDFLMSAFAMFALKYPSLLQFESQSEHEKNNLKRLFRVGKLCSDAQMRKVLDKVDASPLRRQFVKFFYDLKDDGLLKAYEVLGGYLICSVDGVQHFSSAHVHCNQCLKSQHRDGTTTYSHAMLGAVLVHPDQREVFVMGAEHIINQDGAVKNDCELNSHKRLTTWLARHYKEEKLLMVEDALYANGPHLRALMEQDWAYVINVKPLKHKALFQLMDTRQQQTKARKTLTKTDHKGNTYTYQWSNTMTFNNTHPDIKVNMVIVDVKSKKGKTKRFSFITSIPITRRNVEEIVRIGRSRWKIENETFNTLKNQGYHFRHNYGHGNSHLANTLSIIMLLAFVSDQIFQRTSKLFNDIWKATKTKSKLWEMLRAFFMVKKLNSFENAYKLIAAQFFVQLE